MNKDGFLEELMSRRAKAVLEQENLRFPVEHARDSTLGAALDCPSGA